MLVDKYQAVEQLAEQGIHVLPNTLDSWARAGRIPAIKSRSWAYDVEDIITQLERETAEKIEKRTKRERRKRAKKAASNRYDDRILFIGTKAYNNGTL